MTQKQIQRWLLRSAGVLTLGGLAILGWVLIVSIDVPVKKKEGIGTPVQGDGPGTDGQRGDGPSLEELQALASIDLRRPLKDPPPVKVTPPPMQAKFMGTIFEPVNPDQSQALFRMADGSQRFFKAGQAFQEPGGPVLVKEVGDQMVVIVYRDEQRELTVMNP